MNDRSRSVAGICIVASVFVGSGCHATRALPAAPEKTAPVARLALPLTFEPNQGQSDPKVRFVSRSPRYTLFLTGTGAVLSLRKPVPVPPGNRPGAGTKEVADSPAVLEMKLVGADPEARSFGLGELSAKSNYLIGADPGKWVTGVSNYSRVRYEVVYPGIDFEVYGTAERELEYDFVVSPGADPSYIRLAFAGASDTRLEASGDLVLRVGDETVTLRAPVIYQEIAGERRRIAGGYVLRDGGSVGFEVAAYDREKPLVIDPILVYSTHFPFSLNDDFLGIAVDSSGNAYLTGTGSIEFPTTSNNFESVLGGGVFVAKLDSSGSALVYSTYLGGGGSASTVSHGIAVDSSGSIYMVGSTSSADFPMTPGAFQSAHGGRDDVFVAKLNATGSELVYSTYVGGSDHDDAYGGIAVDSSGNAHVTGATYSFDYPTTPGALRGAYVDSEDGGDAFVTKLDAAGSTLVYSTYLGGDAYDRGFGIAVDSSGNAHVTGATYSLDFPTTPGAFQRDGDWFSGDAFVTKLGSGGLAALLHLPRWQLLRRGLRHRGRLLGKRLRDGADPIR